MNLILNETFGRLTFDCVVAAVVVVVVVVVDVVVAVDDVATSWVSSRLLLDSPPFRWTTIFRIRFELRSVSETSKD